MGWSAKLKESQIDALKASKLEIEGTTQSYEQAFKLYLKSAQSTLYLIKTCSKENEFKTIELRTIAGRLVERAERVKKALKDGGGVIGNLRKDRGSIEEQQIVLDKSLIIYGDKYEPWKDSDKSSERSNSSISQAVLSQEQIESGITWCKASTILPEAIMISSTSSGREIEQDNISDCSLVAALIIAEEHRIKFDSNLVLGCLYPKDLNGLPKLSLTGLYNVRLLINGIHRSIDDNLPVKIQDDGIDQLCCVLTSKKDQLWPSLIEKAYLKIMGGYSFAGSNSSVDLYALSGWIPEHLSLRTNTFRADKTWSRIEKAFKLGQCVLTLSTSKETEIGETSSKLVPSHNYAVLDMRERDGRREIEFINPWRADNLETRVMVVNWDTLAFQFECIYLNWNPKLFAHTTNIHSYIESKSSTTEALTTGQGLHLRLKVSDTSTSQDEEIWILLTRHLPTTKSKNDTEEFIGLEISDSSLGLSSPSYAIDSLTNNPCLLYRFKSSPEISLYDIVVAHRGSSQGLRFTLSCFSSTPCSFEDGPPPLPFQKSVKSSWSDRTAGGNHSQRTYMNNPQFQLKISSLPNSPNLLADLNIVSKTNIGITLNVRLLRGGERITNFVESDVVCGSTDYSYGTSSCKISKLRPGNYTIVVSSFSNRDEEEFSLNVSSNLLVNLSSIAMEGAGMYSRTMNGSWMEGFDGGNQELFRNPIYLLSIDQTSNTKIRLQTISESSTPISLHVFSIEEDGSTGIEVASTPIYSDAVCGVVLDTLLLKGNGQGYLVIPSTFTPKVHKEFQILLYADTPVVFSVKQ